MVIHKKIAFSIVSIACGLVMWQAMKNTCPPKEQHLHAVTDVVERTVNKIFEERIQVPEESRQLAEYLSTKVIPEAVEKITKERLDIKDYGVFSIGTITGQGDSTAAVSIGFFDKVFTFSEEQAYDYINSLVQGTDINSIIESLNNGNYGNKNIEAVEGQ